MGDNTRYDDALWRDYARVYDEVLNIIPYRNLLLEIVDAGRVESNMRLLDVCCGTGNLLQALAHRTVTPEVVGIDYSKDMLSRANLKVELYRGRASFVRSNLDKPAKDWGVEGPFDRFVFNNCLSFINDPSAVLRKSSSLAGPTAVLVASMPKPNPNISELLDEHLQLSEELGQSREDALEQLKPHLQRIMFCNERLLNQYGDAFHIPSEPQLRNWFKDSGWQIENISSTYAGQNWLVTAITD